MFSTRGNSKVVFFGTLKFIFALMRQGAIQWSRDHFFETARAELTLDKILVIFGENFFATFFAFFFLSFTKKLS